MAKKVRHKMKNYKKTSFLVLIVICIFGLSACGKKNSTEEHVTYELTTTEPATTTDDEEHVSTEQQAEGEVPFSEENGTLYVKNISLSIPDGYKLFSNRDNTIVYSNLDGASFAVHVENDNPYSKEELEEAYGEKIKYTYGDHVKTTTENVGDNTFTTYNLDAPDNSYVGEAALLVDGTTLIYFEYINLNKDETDYNSIIKTIKYTK